MVCTTLTVINIKPVVSNVICTPSLTIQGQASLSWNQDRAGSITAYVDVSLINGFPAQYPAGTNTVTLSGVTVGSHQVCVDAT